jgi:hypothetical protein
MLKSFIERRVTRKNVEQVTFANCGLVLILCAQLDILKERTQIACQVLTICRKVFKI